MRFTVTSPHLGPQASFTLLKNAVAWLDDKFHNSDCLLDWYIVDNQTGRNVTQKQASKYR